MERVSTFSFEQPLDLSAQSTNPLTRLFPQSYQFSSCNLDSRLTVAALYSHNQNYSVAVVPPRLGDDLVDYSYKKPISLVSPRVEPESSTTPRKSKRSPSVSSNMDKSSVEYRKKRIKNNEAARKSRQKKKETEVEMKRKMNNLKDENTLLRETVHQMNCHLRSQKCITCYNPLIDGLYRYDRISSVADRPSSTKQR